MESNRETNEECINAVTVLSPRPQLSISGREDGLGGGRQLALGTTTGSVSPAEAVSMGLQCPPALVPSPKPPVRMVCFIPIHITLCLPLVIIEMKS